jgi:hypothetical protein
MKSRASSRIGVLARTRNPFLSQIARHLWFLPSAFFQGLSAAAVSVEMHGPLQQDCDKADRDLRYHPVASEDFLILPSSFFFPAARESAKEHRERYHAARVFRGKARNAGEGAAGLSKSSAKKRVTKPNMDPAGSSRRR